MRERVRALIIAEAANPEWVSVPLVGWSLANALRDVADIHIVTQIRNRDAFLRAGLTEGRDFTAIDSEKLAAPLWKLAERLSMGKGIGWTIKTAVSTLGYGYFERLVWRQFGAAIRAGEYDIVHRITPLTPVAASPIAARCKAADVPFVMGPLNGGVPWPKGFDAERRREGEWLSYIRGVYKALPGRGATLAATRAIICGSDRTRSEIPARFQDKTVWLPENAIDPARFTMVASQPGSAPLRGCFIGRLVPCKGCDMAIMAALPLLRSGALTLDFVGDGPESAALHELVARENVGHAVRFHGWLEHRQVQDIAARSQILVFPSVREFGGGAVLEAMALGVVPVIVDYAGPGELVDERTGFRIPLGDRAGIVSALRSQLEAIAADPSVLPQMGHAAREHVMKHFTWAAKARQIEHIWQAVLGNHALPQDLPLPR